MESKSKPTVICLTPIRNEAWILQKFLQAASLWADLIIISDQMSEDNSREIAQKWDKVRIIENTNVGFDEPKMRSLLFEEARTIPGQRLFLCLDADEFLTPNFLSSQEWVDALNSPEGTALRFPLINIRPDMNTYWCPNPAHYFGFMDDGRSYVGGAIHTSRIPIPPKSPEIIFKEIAVLHYQYTDWQRMESKQRWYQCWEKFNIPGRNAVQLYRRYHHMYALSLNNFKPIPGFWFEDYKKLGIDMVSICKENSYWWDRELIQMFEVHGIKTFSKLDVWRFNWQEYARSNHIPDSGKFRNPQTLLDKLIFTWLERTQFFSSNLLVKIIDRFIRLFWK